MKYFRSFAGIDVFGRGISVAMRFFREEVKKVKILIGYDGSSCAEAMLDELQTAGLPEKAEALVMSIAEVWLPPPPDGESSSAYAAELQTRPQPFKAYQTNAKAVTEVETLARHAANRLRRMFPAWTISAETDYGSPAWQIITKANEIEADLIVLGSHGRTAVGRFFLGSISNKVLTEARCSVRIARERAERTSSSAASRVIIGYDGSPGADAAIEAVAAREWREKSVFKIVVATDSLVPTAIGRFVSPVVDWVEDEMKHETKLLEKLAAPALQKLSAANLSTTLRIIAGNPKQILIEEAANWHADAIFLGASRFAGRLEKFLLGSTSAAVAARAACTVEVVRKQS